VGGSDHLCRMGDARVAVCCANMDLGCVGRAEESEAKVFLCGG
jgi:hypothetical protein